jgi:tetratricopeptide (TPR) repeat protein
MTVKDLRMAGNAAFRAGRHKQALRRYTRALALLQELEKKPQKKQAKGGSGSDSDEPSSQRAEGALSGDPVGPRAILLSNCAAAALASGDKEAALRFSADLQKESGAEGWAKGRFRRASVLLASGDSKGAIVELSAVKKLCGDNGEEVPEEVKACDMEAKRAAGMNTDGSEFSAARKLRETGNAFFKAGNYASAIEDYTKALEVIGEDDDPVPIYNNRALCYQQQHEFKAVVADCTEVLKIEEKNVKARFFFFSSLWLPFFFNSDFVADPFVLIVTFLAGPGEAGAGARGSGEVPGGPG